MTREEAIQILRKIIVPTMNWQELYEAINMAIFALSTEAVQVVRCKRCIWGKEWNDKQIFCDRILMRLRENDFCSYGERREP